MLLSIHGVLRYGSQSIESLQVCYRVGSTRLYIHCTEQLGFPSFGLGAIRELQGTKASDIIGKGKSNEE